MQQRSYYTVSGIMAAVMKRKSWTEGGKISAVIV